MSAPMQLFLQSNAELSLKIPIQEFIPNWSEAFQSQGERGGYRALEEEWNRVASPLLNNGPDTYPQKTQGICFFLSDIKNNRPTVFTLLDHKVLVKCVRITSNIASIKFSVLYAPLIKLLNKYLEHDRLV